MIHKVVYLMQWFSYSASVSSSSFSSANEDESWYKPIRSLYAQLSCASGCASGRVLFVLISANAFCAAFPTGVFLIENSSDVWSKPCRGFEGKSICTMFLLSLNAISTQYLNVCNGSSVDTANSSRIGSFVYPGASLSASGRGSVLMMVPVSSRYSLPELYAVMLVMVGRSSMISRISGSV